MQGNGFFSPHPSASAPAGKRGRAGAAALVLFAGPVYTGACFSGRGVSASAPAGSPLEHAVRRASTRSSEKRKPDPARVAILRSLPAEVKATITGEEADQFIYTDALPESLYEKIRDFLVESDD